MEATHHNHTLLTTSAQRPDSRAPLGLSECGGSTQDALRSWHAGRAVPGARDSPLWVPIPHTLGAPSPPHPHQRGDRNRICMWPPRSAHGTWAGAGGWERPVGLNKECRALWLHGHRPCCTQLFICEGSHPHPPRPRRAHLTLLPLILGKETRAHSQNQGTLKVRTKNSRPTRLGQHFRLLSSFFWNLPLSRGLLLLFLDLSTLDISID